MHRHIVLRVLGALTAMLSMTSVCHVGHLRLYVSVIDLHRTLSCVWLSAHLSSLVRVFVVKNTLLNLTSRNIIYVGALLFHVFPDWVP